MFACDYSKWFHELYADRNDIIDIDVFSEPRQFIRNDGSVLTISCDRIGLNLNWVNNTIDQHPLFIIFNDGPIRQYRTKNISKILENTHNKSTFMSMMTVVALPIV